MLKQPVMPKILPLAIPTMQHGVYPELWRPYVESGAGIYIPETALVAVAG